VIVSIVLGLWFETLVNPGAVETASVSFASVALGAPLIEEAAKGAFLLVMLTGRRRNEMNSLTDCLVYAGLTGAGFAWLEDILYIANGESLGESLLTAAMRLIMAPFAHPLFTTMFGIGVYFAMNRRGLLAKAAFLLLGYAGAVVMHGLWNGSSLIGPEAYLGVYVLWMVPIFALAIVLAVHSRRREQRIVAAKLPGMVTAGLITPTEVTWLGSMRARKYAIAHARGIHGKPGATAVRAFAGQVVELAFVKDRIDRGFGDQRVHALLAEEAYAVHAARAAAPTLQWLAGYRVPGGVRTPAAAEVSAPRRPSCGRIPPTPPAERRADRPRPSPCAPASRARRARRRPLRTATRRGPAAASSTSDRPLRWRSRR
jgi:hypothetical protein